MTARHSLSELHLLTAGYVPFLPLTVGFDRAGQQKGQLFVIAEEVHTLSQDIDVNVATISQKAFSKDIVSNAFRLI